MSNSDLAQIMAYMLIEYADRHAQAAVEGRQGAYKFKRSEQRREFPGV